MYKNLKKVGKRLGIGAAVGFACLRMTAVAASVGGAAAAEPSRIVDPQQHGHPHEEGKKDDFYCSVCGCGWALGHWLLCYTMTRDDCYTHPGITCSNYC